MAFRRLAAALLTAACAHPALPFGPPQQPIICTGCSEGDCVTATTITLPAGTTRIADDQFEACNYIEEVVIPDGVKSIGKYAFAGCESLQTIRIPASVRSVAWYAFYDCGCCRLSDKCNWHGGYDICKCSDCQAAPASNQQNASRGIILT